MNNYTKLKAVSLISLALGISACSSSSSSDKKSSTDDSNKTSYTVGVSVPDAFAPVVTNIQHKLPLHEKLANFFLASAYAIDGTDLSAENFAVTIVDPSGNVVEIVEVAAEDISQNPDGTWEISVPGDPRLDCVIVADLDSPASVTVGSPLPTDAVYAPTTATAIDIDIQSTAAYQEFLDNLPATVNSFAELTDISVDEVEFIINSAQQVELPSILPGQTLAEYVAVAITAVEEVVIAEVNVAVNSTTGVLSDAAASGIYWFESEIYFDGSFHNVDYIEYGIVQTGVDEVIYNHNGESFVVDSAGTDWILTSTGWQEVADTGTITTNADGSITFTITGTGIQFRSNSLQTVDVTGMNIRSFFLSDGYNYLFDGTETFTGTGGIAYRTDWTVVNELYEASGVLSCNPDTYIGPDWCSGVHVQPSEATGFFSTTLSDLVSSTAGERGISIGDNLSAELVDNGTSKTVIFYNTTEFPPTQLAETSSWDSAVSNGVTFYRFAVPTSLNESYNVWNGDGVQAYFVQGGFVRQSEYYPANTTDSSSDWFFNATAGSEIASKVNPGLLTLPPR